MVDGLEVDHVNRGGGGSYQVVQILDSGEPLTLSVGPFDPVVAAARGVVVTSLPGDTSLATLPFAGNTVNAGKGESGHTRSIAWPPPGSFLATRGISGPGTALCVKQEEATT